MDLIAVGVCRFGRQRADVMLSALILVQIGLGDHVLGYGRRALSGVYSNCFTPYPSTRTTVFIHGTYRDAVAAAPGLYGPMTCGCISNGLHAGRVDTTCIVDVPLILIAEHVTIRIKGTTRVRGQHAVHTRRLRVNVDDQVHDIRLIIGLYQGSPGIGSCGKLQGMYPAVCIDQRLRQQALVRQPVGMPDEVLNGWCHRVDNPVATGGRINVHLVGSLIAAIDRTDVGGSHSVFRGLVSDRQDHWTIVELQVQAQIQRSCPVIHAWEEGILQGDVVIPHVLGCFPSRVAVGIAKVEGCEAARGILNQRAIIAGDCEVRNKDNRCILVHSHCRIMRARQDHSIDHGFLSLPFDENRFIVDVVTILIDPEPLMCVASLVQVCVKVACLSQQ